MMLQTSFSSNEKYRPATYEQLFKEYIYTNPNIMCKCNTTMEYLCVSNCKQSSLHCRNKQCNFSNQKHKLCKIISLEGLTTLLSVYMTIEPHKNFLTKLFEAEEKLIADMRNRRQSIVRACRQGGFKEQEKVAIQEIYVKKNAQFSKGIVINQLYDKLINEGTKQYISEEINQYQKEIERISQELNKYGPKFSKNYSAALKYDCKMINSKVLSTQQIKRRQQMDFLMEALQEPKGFQLLFRASEHQFSGSKFYEHCNRVKNILVLVKTQSEKIIGGYNPYGWDSSLHGTHTTGQQKKAFIFSVNLKQKMDLVNTNYAVYNYRTYGPAFGGGSDLYLADSCNKNKQSYSNFHSYNVTSKPVINNQSSWTAFSGATNGYYFRVLQYEVFKVIK